MKSNPSHCKTQLFVYAFTGLRVQVFESHVLAIYVFSTRKPVNAHTDYIDKDVNKIDNMAAYSV